MRVCQIQVDTHSKILVQIQLEACLYGRKASFWGHIRPNQDSNLGIQVCSYLNLAGRVIIYNLVQILPLESLALPEIELLLYNAIKETVITRADPKVRPIHVIPFMDLNINRSHLILLSSLDIH